ncbi:MAG: 16S rRNA (cytidine(1402)-2'-O)-methyltransferase [Acidimicrobiales bacterium]|nr:16S rRNA (cytidine(1402)-2'-O)-methyltransferase [Acidimicrobiales bacterium]
MSDGALVLVGTPIGNLGDLSPRAAEALGGADAVCCEDTRRTGKLLSLAGIERRPFVVVNEHTETREVPRVIARLERGERVALVSDAGMPGISDPGERLVAAVLAAGHPVEVVPGPSASLAALVVSGLPAGRFVFEGFLPRKGAGRTERLAAVAAEPRTTVLYEAPHRLARTLSDLAAACGGDRRVAVAREITKLHEQVWRGTLDGAVAWVTEREPPGEIVVVLDGAPASPPADDSAVLAAVLAELASGATARDAARSVASALAVPRRRAYDVAIAAAAPKAPEAPEPPGARDGR